ncbi:MAG: hypothetical protein Q8K85_00385, partial [Hyphomicrobium sp.]|nr:hypothetical protein [Hyphomicrobium sp.]
FDFPVGGFEDRAEIDQRAAEARRRACDYEVGEVLVVGLATETCRGMRLRREQRKRGCRDQNSIHEND